MRPNIPPKPIQPDPPPRRPGARSLKHPRRDPERRVRRHHLDRGNPLRRLAAGARRDIALCAVARVDVGDHGAGFIGERFGGAQVREEVAVAF